MPQPIVIKTEILPEPSSVEPDPPVIQQSAHFEPSPSTSKVSSPKFPSPAKIGQEVVKLFKPTTRAAAKAQNIIVPGLQDNAPPAVCPSKTKTVENQAKRKTQKQKKL